MNNLKRTTIIDRFKNAVRAFRGKPIASVQYGMEIKRCDKCEYKCENPIRDDLLVTAGARAAYMHSMDYIDIPSGTEGESELAKFISRRVVWYLCNGYGLNFDEFIEQDLLAQYGGQNG
jgi:hypothetical protein